jgi:hypothetical protein
MMRIRKSLPGAGSRMPVLGRAFKFLGMGRGILEEEASTVWDGMGGGPRSAASTPPTGDTTDKRVNSKTVNSNIIYFPFWHRSFNNNV